MADPRLLSLVAHYPILCTLVEFLSTLDLFHLSLTCKLAHSYILPSRTLFKALTRQSLCDGRGLIERKELRGFYNIDYRSWPFEVRRTPILRCAAQDEPIEVRLWTLRCEAADALPCIKCGVNVCEECRYLNREALMSGQLDRVPFPHTNAEHGNFMALCPTCDRKMEGDVKAIGYFSDVCDCDAYTRWICLKCRKDEVDYDRRYNRDCAKGDWCWEPSGEDESTMEFGIHQSSLWLWCWCGNKIPQETVTRCTWCKRKHLPWTEGLDRAEAARRARQHGDYLEFDPCYAAWQRPYDYVFDRSLPPDYPKLEYDGVIWTEKERLAHISDAQQVVLNTDTCSSELCQKKVNEIWRFIKLLMTGDADIAGKCVSPQPIGLKQGNKS